MNNKPTTGDQLLRAGTLQENESGKIELSFSSEEPVERSFGFEILAHNAEAVDLSRLQEIGTVLFNHDTDKPIGKIEKAWIENNRGKALISFDTDKDSQEIAEKVKRGSLRGVSVGYRVQEWEDVTPEGAELATFKATKWQPYEISIVAVPADPSVGVGRSMIDTIKGKIEETRNAEKTEEQEGTQVAETQEQEKTAEIIAKSDNMTNNLNSEQEIHNMNLNEKKNTKIEDAQATKIEAPQTDSRSILEAERSRIKEITTLCREFDVNADKLINEGATVDQARSAILEQLKTRQAPVSVKVEKDETDKFRAAAVDALALRAGAPISKPADGAETLRGYSLKKLAVECLARDPMESRGYAEINRMNDDQLFAELQRSFYNPSAVFPAIMDASIKKSFVEAYKNARTSFEAWCSKGSLSDFKETKEHNYIIGGGSFEKVNENGELTASKPSTELLPTRKLDTYGTQFTMTREAFINDDIGLLSKIPSVYAVAAKRKINRQVYELLQANAKIYDGKALFGADHGNLISTGAKPTLSSINDLMLLLQKQRDPFGEAINVTPRTLVLPVGYGMEVKTLLHSASITTSDSQNTGYNPLADSGLTFVEDATLNQLAGNGAAAWYMVADPMTAKSVQIDYLNGQEVPTIRRMEKAGQLGFSWDIFLDWGISVIDYRGIAKNAGVKID